jgi:uncharacterized membrane protein YfcA
MRQRTGALAEINILDHLILFLFLALLAEILGTLGGFGSSMLFVPIAGLFLDFHSVLAVTALFHVASNVTKIYAFKGGFDKRIVLSLGIPAVIFVTIGGLATNWLDARTLEISISVFIILLSILLLIFRNARIKPTTFNSIAGGSLSGFLAGMFGTGGAVRGITLAAFHLDKNVFIVTSAIIDLGIDSTRSLVYLYNGFVHKHDLYLVLYLLIISIIGTYLGKYILKFVSEERFRAIVLLLTMATGAVALAKMIW